MHTMFHNSHGLALLCICGLPMVRQSTTAHVWHCKILNAPSNFGDIFAHALVAQTRPLLTFPTIRSIIEASLLCDPGLWDYPSQSKALLLHFDKWEILRIFSLFGIAISTFWILNSWIYLINWFEMTPSVQLSHYTWLNALISDAMNPRFSQMKTNSLTQCDSILMIETFASCLDYKTRQFMSLPLWNSE